MALPMTPEHARRLKVWDAPGSPVCRPSTPGRALGDTPLSPGMMTTPKTGGWPRSKPNRLK
eukprot:scaffold564144_cov42-Prasinocladus_malaysianus.AAC.1